VKENHDWHEPRLTPFVILALAGVLFMATSFDPWEFDPWTFVIAITATSLLTLTVEASALRIPLDRLLQTRPRAQWFGHYGLASALGSITLIACLEIIGLSQQRAGFVLVLVVITRAANTYIIAYGVDELISFRRDADLARAQLKPSLQLITYVNTRLDKLTQDTYRHDIDTINDCVMKPLVALESTIQHQTSAQAAREVESFIDDQLRPLSQRLHPIAVKVGLIAALAAEGIDVRTAPVVREMDSRGELLDELVQVELFRWITSIGATGQTTGASPSISLVIENRALRIDVTTAVPAELDARQEISGMAVVGPGSITAPLRGQFIDQTAVGRPQQMQDSKDGARLHITSRWTGENDPPVWMIALVALGAAPAVSFIANSFVGPKVIVATAASFLVPVVLYILMQWRQRRRRSDASLGLMALWWLGIGLATSFTVVAIMVVFGSSITLGSFMAEVARYLMRLSLFGGVLTLFGALAASARTTVAEVAEQREVALAERWRTLTDYHERARLIAEVLHRRVQSRLAGIALLFHLDQQSDALAQLREITSELLPQLLTALTDSDLEHAAHLNTVASAKHIHIEYRESPALNILRSEHPRLFGTMVDECAANAYRHGRAQRMRVEVTRDGNWWHVTCSNNGKALDENWRPGLGARQYDDAVGPDGSWSMSRVGATTVVAFTFRASSVENDDQHSPQSTNCAADLVR